MYFEYFKMTKNALNDKVGKISSQTISPLSLPCFLSFFTFSHTFITSFFSYSHYTTFPTPLSHFFHFTPSINKEYHHTVNGGEGGLTHINHKPPSSPYINNLYFLEKIFITQSSWCSHKHSSSSYLHQY